MESENFKSDINILELHRVGEINVEICKLEELATLLTGDIQTCASYGSDYED